MYQASYTCIAPNEKPGADLEAEPLCGDPTVAKSLCGTHNRRMTRNGTLTRTRRPKGTVEKKRPPNRQKCTVKGCPNPHLSAGYCGMHHSRWVRNGDPGPVEKIREVEVREDPKCIHPGGCKRPPNGGLGWCRMHRQRIRDHGDPGGVEPLVHRPHAVARIPENDSESTTETAA